MNDNKEKKEKPSEAKKIRKNMGMVIGMCIGMAIGIAIGAKTQNVGRCLSLGLCIGLIAGVLGDSLLQKPDNSKQSILL